MKTLNIQRTRKLSGHHGSVYALEVLPEGLVTAGSDKVIALWDHLNGSDGTQLAKASHVVYSLFYDAATETLLAGQSAGGIHVIDLKEKKESRLLQYHEAPVFSMAVSLKHKMFFSGDGSGLIHVSQAGSFTPLTRFKAGEGKIRSILIDDASNRLIAGTAEGMIHVISLPELTPVISFAAHQADFGVNALCLTQGGLLLSGSRDAHLNVFDAANGFRQLQSIPAHNYAIYSIAMHPNGRVFATASRDKTVKLWDAETMEVIARIDKEQYDGHTASVNILAWDQEGKLVTTGDDRMVMVWEVGG